LTTTDHNNQDFLLTTPLMKEGTPMLLLASCFGDRTGGGIFAWDGAGTEQIDTLSTTGLSLHGGRVTRLLKTDGKHAGSEMLVYDASGIRHYHRLDFVKDAHDVAWDGEGYLVVSSGDNTIYRISPSGEIAREWKFRGTGDSCHLNCLTILDTGVAVSAFGMFEHHDEWDPHKMDGSGLVFDLETGRKLMGGLDCPHHPRFFDEAWGVCNSSRSEFVQIDAVTGAILRKAQLRGWTRGVAVSDDHLFVGESNRAMLPGARTSIAVICRRTWEILGRIHLSSDELYDLVMVPPSIVEGVRIGFRTNPHRVAEQGQRSLFQQAGVEPLILWALSDPLPAAACKVEVICVIPPVLKAGVTVNVECTVVNRGTGIFVSALPNPVHIASKWAGTGETNKDLFVEGDRTVLPRSLPPGQQARCLVAIRAPSTPGRFRLTVTLVQEFCVWFDDVDPANGFYSDVMVEACD